LFISALTMLSDFSQDRKNRPCDKKTNKISKLNNNSSWHGGCKPQSLERLSGLNTRRRKTSDVFLPAKRVRF
jgi:hypothetical protein